MQFNWSPGIGDPTVGGWVTVVLYLFATIGCWRCANRLHLYNRHGARELLAWRFISVLFLALGINKQLDLQTALTEVGRVLAFSEGWYEQRRAVQVVFIISVAITCVLTAITLLVWARDSPAPTWLALVGSTFVLGFVIIRAASFHHIDRFIGNQILGLRWNWVLEMGGIVLVLLASIWRVWPVSARLLGRD